MNPAHLDYDTLAELAEGLLDDDHAASANAHLNDCAECQDRSADIADVSRILAETPAPPMPTELAARIDAAIAAELLSTATVTSLEKRRGNRQLRILSAAAAAVVVLGGGALVGRSVIGSGSENQTANSSPQVPADREHNGIKSDESPSVGSAPGMTTDKARPNFVRFTVAHSGTAYQALTLKTQVGRLLGKGGELSTEGTAPTPAQTKCVTEVTKGATPALVDSATYDGTPAMIIALTGPTTQWDIWVVGPSCTTGNINQLAHTQVAK